MKTVAVENRHGRRGRTAPSNRRRELLEVARSDAAKRRPKDVLAQWVDDPTVRPSPIDLRTTVAYDALALDSAPEYEALLLSPVAPLGVTSVLAPTSQDRVLSTTRGTEVVSDATNVLALECALRLRRDPHAHVRLSAIHQLLRMQPASSGPGRTQHFRLMMLADAGRGHAGDGFEIAAVTSQLDAYRRLLDVVAQAHDLAWEKPTVIIRSNEELPAIGERLHSTLTQAFPDVATRLEPLTSSYYGGLRLGYGLHDRSGTLHEVVDLGAFDWVAQLTSNRRHRFIASAIGLQLLPLLFGSAEHPSTTSHTE